MPLDNGIDCIGSLPCSTRRNHRYVDGIRHRVRQLHVVPNACTIAIDAREQNFPCPEPHALARPGYRFELGASATDIAGHAETTLPAARCDLDACTPSSP